MPKIVYSTSTFVPVPGPRLVTKRRPSEAWMAKAKRFYAEKG